MIRPSLCAIWSLLWLAFGIDTSSTFAPTTSAPPRQRPEFTALPAQQQSDSENSADDSESRNRRNVILGWGVGSSLLAGAAGDNSASAATLFPRSASNPSSLYVVTPGKNVTEYMQREPLADVPSYLSSEVCLLKLLPVRNPFFRQLEASVQTISTLRSSSLQPADVWRILNKEIEHSITELDNKRSQLQPVFNPEDSTMLQITKSVRGEQLIESLRERLVDLSAATRTRNTTCVFLREKDTLLALAEVGELLVSAFPYDIPTEGKFSYLPRLLGRARVTFSFRRKNKLLGNVTIVADGFAAPLTAGNFVDLSLRGFYNGLPIKYNKKRLGSGGEFEVANIPILGSFQEGFYDPLTAKPRRLPLEIIRNEKGSGVPNLSYAQGLSNILSSGVTLEPMGNSKPLLSFNIPGLVGLNHPDNNPNGGSSEFFSIQEKSMADERRGLLDGEYAPFGYIVDGYALFQNLEAGDVIDATCVDEWGQLNLAKLRRSSFSEVVQGSEAESL